MPMRMLRHLFTLVILQIFGVAELHADIQCYACNSYLKQCGQRVDNSHGALFRSRCAGQCFARQGEDNAIYRGCFDAFDEVPNLVATYVGCRNQTWNNRQLLWCLCDTNLCNGNDLLSIGRTTMAAKTTRLPSNAVYANHPADGDGGAMLLQHQPRDQASPLFDDHFLPLANYQRTSDEGPHHHKPHHEVETHDITGEQQAINSGSGKSSAGDEDQYRSMGKRWNVEPMYYLPAGLLERGPYIWTPDDRPPYIVEKIEESTNELQQPQFREPHQQKEHPSDDYFNFNGYGKDAETSNSNLANNNNNQVTNNDDFAQYDYHGGYSEQPEPQGARRSDNGGGSGSAGGTGSNDGQVWWASRIDSIVNGRQRGDGAAASLSDNAIKGSNIHDSGVENELIPHYNSWSEVNRDLRIANHAELNLDDKTGYGNRGEYDVSNEQSENRWSTPDERNFGKDEEIKGGQRRRFEQAVSTKQSPSWNSLNEFLTKTDASMERLETHNSVMDEARCTSDAGYHLHPEDCHLYYACIIHHNGLVPVVMRCPVGLAWDDRLKLCVVESSTCRRHQQGVGVATLAASEVTRSAAREAEPHRELEFVYRW